MLCQFLQSNSVYIQTLLFNILFHPSPGDWIQSPGLYSRTLLFIILKITVCFCNLQYIFTNFISVSFKMAGKKRVNEQINECVYTVWLLFCITQTAAFFFLMHRQTISGQISSLFHFSLLTSDFLHPQWKGHSNFTPQPSLKEQMLLILQVKLSLTRGAVTKGFL